VGRQNGIHVSEKLKGKRPNTDTSNHHGYRGGGGGREKKNGR